MSRVDWGGILDVSNTGDNPPSIREIGLQWLELRTRRGVLTVADDESRFRHWIEPPLGQIRVDELSARIVTRWLARVSEAEISGRTVRRIYQVLVSLMKFAALEGWIKTSPCMHSAQLPPDVDANPERLALAPLSPSEVVRLMSSQEIPINRRALYGLGCLAGLRIGEIAGLNWGDLDSTRRPLAALSIVRQLDSRTRELRPTKTRTPRIVPVHARLGELLSEWRSLYARTARRMPTSDSPMLVAGTERRPAGEVPGRWNAHSAKKALGRDCERLGISRRTPHNMRTTFVSLARNAPDASPRDLIEKITHTKKRDVIDLYTVSTFSALCRAVSAIELPQARASSSQI